MRNNAKDAMFLQWLRLDVSKKSCWVTRNQSFGQCQMVGCNVDVCVVSHDIDWSDIRRKRRHSEGPRIEISARKMGRTMAADGVVTVVVVKIGFIPIV